MGHDVASSNFVTRKPKGPAPSAGATVTADTEVEIRQALLDYRFGKMGAIAR